MDRVDNHLIWNLHPGQVAQVLTASALNTYVGAQGVVIHEGTRAMIYLDGTPVADLRQGTYDFPRAAAERDGGLLGLLCAGAQLITALILGHRREAPGTEDTARQAATRSALSAIPRTVHRASVLLVREGPLPLILTLKHVVTDSIATDIALQCMVEIVDSRGLQRMLLIDREGLTLGELGEAITPIADSALRVLFRKMPAEAIIPDPALEQQLAESLTAALASDWSFLRVIRVVRVSAQREEFVRLQRLRDSTHLSGPVLEQVAARNDFMNRLRLEKNRSRLQEAKGDEELLKQLQEINKDGLLREFDLASFQALFSNERRIREAVSEDQYQAAIARIRRTGLLRDDEAAFFERAIAERNQDNTNKRLQAIELYDLGRRLESDKARLQWEYEVGDKRIELELARKRREYAAKSDLTGLELQHQQLRDDYADRRSRSQTEIDHGEQLAQLETARKAQELTETRRQNEHQRELEIAAQRREHEHQRQLVEAQRWTNMSTEQIVAANPGITSAAAAALAEKYKAEVAGNAGDISARAAERNAAAMHDLTKEQIAMLQKVMEYSLSANAGIAGALIADRGRQVEQARGSADSSSRSTVCRRCGKSITSPFCEDCGQ